MSILPGKQEGKKKPAKKKGVKAPLEVKEKKSDKLKDLGVSYELEKVENPDHRTFEGHKYTAIISFNGKITKHAHDRRPTIDNIITMWKSTQPRKKMSKIV